MAQGVNVRMQFLRKPDGTPVSGQRAKEIRKFAVQLWRSWAEQHGPDSLPKTWAKGASIAFHDTYNKWMRSKAFECQLCPIEENWICEQITILGYSHWRRRYLRKLYSGDKTDNDEDDEAHYHNGDDDDAKKPTHGKKCTKTNRQSQKNRTKTANKGKARGRGKKQIRCTLTHLMLHPFRWLL